MIDLEVVLERLAALQTYVAQLRPWQARSIDEVASDPVRYWGILHGLQLACQCVMDVSAHIQAALGLERAPDYTESIRALGRHGVIDPALAERASKMPGFRNILVHEYLEVDEQKVYETLRQGLDDFDAFVEQIHDYLKREGYLAHE